MDIQTHNANGGPLGGIHAEQGQCYAASAGLMLLNMRVDEATEEVRSTPRVGPNSEPIPTTSRICLRLKRGSLGERFVTKAHGTLVDTFKAKNVSIQAYVDGEVLMVLLVDANAEPGNKSLGEPRALEIVKEFEEVVKPGGEDKFRWDEVVQNIVSECKALIESLRLCNPSDEPAEGEWEKGVLRNLDKERARAIVAEKIVACGLPMMEYAFSAGGSQILYPDPREFTDDHWELWAKFSPFTRSRGMLDFMYCAAVWLPHEVLHCIQDGALKVTGAGSNALHNWQCEYCVCKGQSLFLATVIAENRKKGVNRTLAIPSHFLEESLLWLEGCLSVHPTEAPQAWLADKAASAPIETQPYEYMEEAYPEYIALLGRVVLDSFASIQSTVEKDEQTTSYWAEFVKYTNRILKTTSAEAIPTVTESL